ncbi:MAG: DUF5688 family protein [Eubacteriales bacterium]
MEYVEFIETIKLGLRQRLGETIQIEIHDLLKNNVKREVMVIKIDTDRVTPCIPLESVYAMYQLDESLDDIIDKVVEIEQDNAIVIGENLIQIKDWDVVKELVESRVVSSKNNQKFLLDVPHKEFLDCSVVYYVNANNWVEGDHRASIKVTNEKLAMWGVSIQELDEWARKNYYKQEIIFQSMEEVLLELLGEESNEEESVEVGNKPMYVLSNKDRKNGAVVMLDEETLHSVYGNLKDTFYLIPSSVHELIVIPSEMALGVKELKEMVVSVNQTEVDEEDILTDSIYYYDGEKVNVVA